MSEIHNPLVIRNQLRIGDSRISQWHSVRLVAHRSSAADLTVALITTTWAGASAFEYRAWAGQVDWLPQQCTRDLRLYALRRALLAVSQTHH